MDEDQFSFITDQKLKSSIVDSIQYIYILIEQASDKEANKIYQTETYRVIILYIVSIIEAILFFVYKHRGEKILFIDYKFVTNLPKKYTHSSDTNCPIVIAVQKDMPKVDQQIGLFELVKFFQSHKLMKTEFAKDILEINDIRNTFHFNKPRGGIIFGTKQVETSLDLLLRVIQRAPKALIVKN